MVSLAKTFLLCQIWIIKYSVKYSTVECKYLLFYKIVFSLNSNQNSIKNANIADCLKNIWKLIKQNKLFDGINDVIFDDPYLME